MGPQNPVALQGVEQLHCSVSRYTSPLRSLNLFGVWGSVGLLPGHKLRTIKGSKDGGGGGALFFISALPDEDVVEQL